MPTLHEIEEQIKSIDGVLTSVFTRKEIKELPNILNENEKIDYVIIGMYEKNIGILVATDSRLIFVDKGMLWGLKVEIFPLDKISSVQYETGLVFGKLIIFASGNKAIIDNTDKQQVRIIGELIRQKILKKQHSEPIVKETSHDDMISKLEKLATLKEKGILTEEEFTTQKKRILEG